MLPHVAGLDVGFSTKRKSTGFGWYRDGVICLGHDFRPQACDLLLNQKPFDVIAVDGPVLPKAAAGTAPREVERIFSSGAFARRCKPGMSHWGVGYRLRTAAAEAGNCLCVGAPIDDVRFTVPRVVEGAIIEAFPNAFLGVCLEEQCYERPKKLRRGQKFDWLYDQWMERNVLERVISFLPGDATSLADCFARTKHHDERAALVCVLTALFAAVGNCVAVGCDATGWFFLPPREAWAPWAWRELESLLASGKYAVKIAP